MIRLVIPAVVVASTALLGVSGAFAAPALSAVWNDLPLRFEENHGQAPKAVRFLSRGDNFTLAIEGARNRLTWSNPQSKTAASLETRFVGANAYARIAPLDPLPTTTNYLVGNSPQGWFTGVRNYGRIQVRDLYPGVDLVFYGRGSSLEYDFIVTAGADPRAIQFDMLGANRKRVDSNGDLVLTTDAGTIRWKRPTLYQETAGVREPIEGRFRLSHGRVSFRLGAYDHARPLVIDPVLAYASYFGSPRSASGGFEVARAIGVDGAGNVYIAGGTPSNDLPVTAGVVQTAYGGGTANEGVQGDIFVAKFTPAGAVSYVTYLGGSGDEGATALAVDSAGDVYLTGSTTSRNFPTTPGVVQSKFNGYGGNTCIIWGDAFAVKLNPSGSKLDYSTYLGGSLDDAGMAITLDSAGNAYIAGWTLSTDFPVVSAAQAKFGGFGGEPGKPMCNGSPITDTGDAFVAKLNPTATALVFSTYLGGTSDDAASSIAIDSLQNVYVAGSTLSIDFPVTKGVLQNAPHGFDGQNEFYRSGDGFIAKLSSSGSSVAYSTYLGGAGDDAVTHIVVDKAGTVYATGSTSSYDFPVTSGAVQPKYGGYQTLPNLIEQNIGDAFVIRLSSDGSKLLYSTYLGGSANDAGGDIAVDPSGLIYVAGATDSTDFTVTKNALQSTFAGDDTSVSTDYFPVGDGFFAILDPNLTSLVYSTYYGGRLDEGFAGLAMDAGGNVWMTGGTQSPNLMVTANAFQKSYTGGPVGVPRALQSLLLEFSTAATAGGPVLKAVTNAASGQVGVVAPGMIFVGYGTNLGPSQLIGDAVDPVTGLLASTRAGISVLFDNIPAPLVYLNSTSIAGIVPYALAGKASTQMVVEVEGQRSAPLAVPVQATVPGVFSLNYSGAGQAVAFNYTSAGPPSLNSATNPIPKGATMVIYATGEGQTMPAGQDGLISTSTAPMPVAPVSVTIGGVTQPNIEYAGGIPGEAPGVLQVNFVIAPDTPSGVQPVVITIGSNSSQQNLTVAVQ